MHGKTLPCTIHLREAGEYDPAYVEFLLKQLQRAAVEALHSREQVQVIRHDDVATYDPPISPGPGIDQRGVDILACQQGLSVGRANSQEDDVCPVAAVNQGHASRMFASSEHTFTSIRVVASVQDPLWRAAVPAAMALRSNALHGVV